MIALLGILLTAFAPLPWAILGAAIALSQLDLASPTPPSERKLPAQEWEW